MLIKVCANGARDIEDHAALSLDPDEVAADCSESVRAGAGAIHVHPKNRRGEESLRAPDVDRWVAAMRRRCPGVPVGVTTGAWTMPDLGARLREIDAWNELPDFASVNWHEDGAEEVAAKLLEHGIGIEAGIWHEHGLNAWAESAVRSRCLRVLVEVQDMDPCEARENGRSLVDRVRALEPALPILLHGEERSTWASIELAGQLHLDTRAGLEDCLTLPNGSAARGNADVVQTAVGLLAHASGRQ